MLELHRITRFNEFIRCHASGQILMYGDFYYTNDDGKVISAKYYQNEKMQKLKDEWPYTKEKEQDETLKEYQDNLRKKEKEYLTKQMLKEEVAGAHEGYNMELAYKNRGRNG